MVLRLSGKKTINYKISPWKTKTNDDYWYTKKKFCRGGVPAPEGGSAARACACSGGGRVPARGVGGGVSAARGVPAPGCVCVCETPPVTATAAGGTHPTGMHSCLEMF